MKNIVLTQRDHSQTVSVHWSQSPADQRDVSLSSWSGGLTWSWQTRGAGLACGAALQKLHSLR